MNNRRNQLMLASAREYCKCVVEGKTIKYNQLLVEGNFPTTNSWYSNGLTANVTNNVLSVYCTTAYQSVYNPNSLVEGHKYLFCLWARNLNGIPSFAFGWHSGYSTDIPITTDWRLYACVTPPVASGSDYAYIYPRGVGSAEFKKYQIIDLTELGLDNINSVADFYATDLGKYIRKGNYLETTSGAFIQAKTPINFKGVNIWNEQTTLVSNHLESENINCLPNKNYYFSCSREGFAVIGTIYWYDKNGTQLDYNDFYERNIVSPSNSAYFKLVFNSTYGTTYNHDICISENAWDENWELVNSKLTSKSPIKVFEGATYFITAPLLWGIFESDASGNMGNGIETYSVSGGYRFKIPKNCHYIMFNMASSYGSTYNNDIAIFYVGYQKYCGKTGKVFVIDYNQQIKNGNFATTDDWISLNCNLSASNNELKCRTTGGTSVRKSITCVVNVVKEHKYLLLFKAKAPRNVYGYVTIGSSDSMGNYSMYDAYSQQNYIFTNPLLEGEQNLNIFIDYGQNTGWLTSGEDVYIKECLLIDLTALGMDNISTISAFNNTDLGQLIAEKGYLPYSQRNVGYALGKQLQKGDYYKTYCVDKVSYNQLVQNGNFESSSNWEFYLLDDNYRFNNGSLEILDLSSASSVSQVYLSGFTNIASTNKIIACFDIYSQNDSVCRLSLGNGNSITMNLQSGRHTYYYFYTAIAQSSEFSVFVNTNSSNTGNLTFYKAQCINLTSLGINVASLEEFYRTPLGMLVKKGFYLNYTTSNKTIKPQLIRTMKEIDMEDLNWQSEEFGYYALLPSDCKKVESNEIPNLLATNYKITSAESSQSMEIKIDDIWGIGWCFAIQGLYNEPTGKLMYELSTPIIVDEEIEDIMVSRRTIGVESDNGIDLDFTKE